MRYYELFQRRINMHLGYFAMTKYSGKILSAFLTALIVCAPTPATDSRANAAPDEWDEVFDTARAVLAKLPDPARIEATIKDSALREAALRAYRAVKACAKVNKGQSNSQKRAFVAEFETAFKAVQTEVGRGEYRDCASTCVTDGSKCEKDCQSAKKKVCACKMTEFGCVMKCLFG
jgi:predicted lipid-binding transport protein (Tim44 family)